ncbi:hTAFII28-like protein conserved region-domain-containing protein [Dichotomopilus funicola]|uniref:HTAFII28-like protein conserved region-domain-containing protein n=1 Tax=Dichotomopilus funicola TaxID=1934379 RepID=A0AAN6ZIX2_9PEZI|nr:hTAFII28-like protein conserved region-domain-containing protein [Dichotomopilus funicola]
MSSTNKKRTADGVAAPALKRRKASTISTASGAPGSAHPLRQTSFPPDDSSTLIGSARSPSVDVDNMSLVSGSQVSAAAPLKKKRGRKSKADKAREQTPSIAGGRAATAASGASEAGGGRGGGGKSTTGGAGGGDEGEGEDEGPTEVAATADVRTKEQKEEEHRMRGMLISALSEDQFYRFENWRAANLSKASVRRVNALFFLFSFLVNATISQSVAENVVIGMRAVAKVFIGDVIESARRVQGEWIEKLDEKQTDLPSPLPTIAPTPDVSGEADTQPAEATTTDAAETKDTRDTRNSEVNDRRGPLRPEHLREAVRRYRKGFEGGGVGMQWVYHQQQQGGVERFPTRTGGRRLFR